MTKLQAKTELARNHIMSLFKHFVSVDEDGVSLLCYVTFDTMAEIVDFLRGDIMIIDLSTGDKAIEGAKELTFEAAGTFVERIVAEQRKINDYDRLLDENLRLSNACELLKNRICELIKKYKEE